MLGDGLDPLWTNRTLPHPATLCAGCGRPGVRIGTTLSPTKKNRLAWFRCAGCMYRFKGVSTTSGRARPRWRIPARWIEREPD